MGDVEGRTKGSNVLGRAVGAIGSLFGRKRDTGSPVSAAVYAETLAYKAVALLQQGYRVQGFLNLRSAYQGFQALPEEATEAFGEGDPEWAFVRARRLYGVGLFQMLMSYVPPKIMRYLNLVGFTADRDVGTAMLQECSECGGSMAPAAQMLLVAKDLIDARFAFNMEDERVLLEHAWALIGDLLKEYPDGPVFPWLASQVARSSGRLDES